LAGEGGKGSQPGVAICRLKKVWERGKNMPEHTFTFEQIRHQAQENALAYL
jgi:hypothetical protein